MQNATAPAAGHKVVSREQWLKERTRLLAEEKAFMREHDALSQKVRDLPWEKVEKSYVFEGVRGQQTREGVLLVVPERVRRAQAEPPDVEPAPLARGRPWTRPRRSPAGRRLTDQRGAPGVSPGDDLPGGVAGAEPYGRNG